MRVALVGSSGYISSYLLQRFYQEKNIESILRIDQNSAADQYLDLSKADEFDYSCLSEIDYIVFTAAISGPDQCASDFDFCWKINVEGTKYFIKKALGNHCQILFFSSDAVFGDASDQIYSEKTETKANTPYGKMKKHIEDEFKLEMNFKALRLSYVVSANDRFVSYCMKCAENDVIADIFHPFYRNCVVISDVVDAVIWLLNNWDTYQPSVLNVAGKELVSRIRIADELNRYLGIKLRYQIFTPDQEFFKNRAQITQMKSLYIQNYHILEESTFTEKIQKALEKEKKAI